MYHRIADETCDPWGLCVSASEFDEQLAVLADHRAVVDLAAFTDDDTYRLTDHRLAVTFDDGYLDNLRTALPLLEKHEIPATLFVVGHAIGRRREFWWDALQRAVLESGPLPEVLDFPFGSGVQRHLVDHRESDPVAADWRADGATPGGPRQQLFGDLWSAIVVLPPAEQDAAVDHLLQWAGQPLEPPSTRLPMSPDELAAFAGHPLITIGNHTLDHLSLPDLSPERQQAQVTAGHQLIAELTGRPPDRFSYPFGRYAEPARNALQSLGVELGCTSVPRTAGTGDDRRALPRLQATGMDGDEFARWLRTEHALLR